MIYINLHLEEIIMRNKKLVHATVVTALCLAVLTGCSSKNEDTASTPTPSQTATVQPTAEPTVAPSQDTTTVTLKDGTYTKKSEAPENDYTYEMKMTVEGGKITALTYEGYDKDGNSKTQLSLDGKYVMTEDGPTWAEQAQALAAYVVEHQSTEGIKMDADGKTDAVSGVSISVNGFVDFANALLKEAAAPATTSSLKDGSYTKKSEAPENDYTYEMKMTVEGGKITALTYEGYDKDGNSKTQLSLDGKYVMTENGPTWAEQAQALAAYVVEHQSTDGIKMDADGKTDAVSGVSISVNGFVDFANALLKEAAQ